MSNVSTVISVVKEEIEFLPRVLASLKGFSDEIVLVDMTQTDEIKSVAKKYNAKIYEHKFVNYVEPVRNFGIEKASNEWIFILDPDEELSEDLAKELKSIISENKAEYVRIPRKNIVFGKWLRHSRWWPDYNIRFFKKGYVSWNEIIHAVPVTTGRGIDLEAKEELAIVHHHYDSIEQYVERMNRYTGRYAESKIKEGYKFNWIDLVKKPSNEFLSRFFFGEGYKDGVHGLALSLLQAFSELVVYLKIWQKEKFEEHSLSLGEVAKVSQEIMSDTKYWIADSQVKTNGGIIPRIKRKLKI